MTCRVAARAALEPSRKGFQARELVGGIAERKKKHPVASG